jgi:DnaJ like chaperone protein
MGPFGALLGLFVGHLFDRGLASVAHGFGQSNPAQTAETQETFFTTVFVLIGHLAKADGQVSTSEITQTELFMRQMGLTIDHRERAMALFKQGRDANFDLAATLEEFIRVCGRFGNLRQMLLVYLIGVALADDQLHQAEDAELRRIALAIGFNAQAYETLLTMISAQSQFAGFGGSNDGQRRSAGRQTSAADITLAYQALGISPTANDAQVRRAYRKLISEYHPDKLIGQGLPKDMIDVATERSQEVQTAYDLIKKSRKL